MMITNDPKKGLEATAAQNTLTPFPLERLPEELIVQIFSNLGVKDVLSIAETCKYFYLISKDDMLWKVFCRQLSPNAEVSSGYLSLYDELAHFRSVQHHLRMGLHNLQTLGGHKHRVSCVKCAKDMIISGSWDHTIRIWDAKTGRVLHILRGHSQDVVSLLVEGDRLFTGSWDRTIRVWDINTGEHLQTISRHLGTVHALTIMGDFIFVSTGLAGKKINVFNKETGEFVQTMTNRANAVGGNMVGKYLTTVSCFGALQTWNEETLENLRTFETLENLRTSKGERVFQRVFFRCASIQGDDCLMGFSDGVLRIMNIETGALRTLEGHTGEIWCLLAVRDELVITGSEDKTIKIWNKETGQLIHTLAGHTRGVYHLKLMDHFLVSAGDDSTIKIWDIEKGVCLQTLVGHTDMITSLEIDGNRLITASSDLTVKIWDFNFSRPSPYSLQHLEENFKMLGEMAAFEDGEDGDGVAFELKTQINKLHPDFQDRLEEYFLKHGSSSSKEIFKEAILHVQAEVCVELLLHALYYGNKSKVHELLDQLHAIDAHHMDKLYGLLCSECGVKEDLEWGKNAFYDLSEAFASNLDKIHAMEKFRDILKA